MVREWRHLKMLKRSGHGHLIPKSEEHHSCALLCPACPHPGINLPTGWEQAPKETRFVLKYLLNVMNTCHMLIIIKSWLYTLYLALDANFRMSRKGVSTKQRDPCLTRGRGYFVEDEGFLAHLEAHQGHRQEVCNDSLSAASLRALTYCV